MALKWERPVCGYLALSGVSLLTATVLGTLPSLILFPLFVVLGRTIVLEVKNGTNTRAVAPVEVPSSSSGPLSSAEQDEYADRIDELLDQEFASDRHGDEITDEEFAEAVRWVVEGPRLATGELLAFLKRNTRLPADPDPDRPR